MLDITVHHAADLSRGEISAVVSLLWNFWPNEDKTIDQVVEAFPEVGKQYRDAYPQVRLPSLHYVVWDGNKAVAYALTFERPVITNGGELSVMALSGVCVWPSYQGRGLGAEIVRRAFGRIDAGEFAVSLFQTTIPAFYEKLGATSVTNSFANSRHKEHGSTNPWRYDSVMIYPKSYPWPEGPIDLNGPGY
ncbi:MAG TPA: GNAT family N-acetyltransferase [Candidatus Binatia bacterium]|jgi:predicted N-acetyltransferase YhbS